MIPQRWALIVFLVGYATCVAARDSTQTQVIPPTRTITILSDVEGATAFINGEKKGHTPVSADLAEGHYTLLIVHPDHDDWRAESIRDSFEVEATSRDTLHFRFGQYVSITSDPFGAEVVIEDSIVGTTPMVFQNNETISATLLVRKPGYEPATLDLRSDGTNKFTVTLARHGTGTGTDPSDVFSDHSYSSSSSLRLYIAGAAAVISGALAAHFKLKADDNYAAYRFTRDPAALDRTHRFDTAAALSIAATQISVGLFTYFILSD
ncbi:MAG: PEGA domain-containing protein [Bacteroidota bacterium]